MADVDFSEYDDGYDLDHGAVARTRTQRWINIAGALTSIALVIGAGVWGYRIAVRDVMGIPVVRALEGPMRVAPENPGGTVAEYQGLSVNDVAAIGAATPLPDSIVLAPRPVDLSAEDMPGLASAAVTPAIPQDQAAPGPLRPAGTEVETAVSAPAEVVALADQLASVSEPQDQAIAVAAVVPGGIGRSLLPRARPGSLAPVGQASVSDVLAVLANEVDADTLPPGTRLVQFGAYDSEDQARAEWDKLAGRFGELMTGKARVIQSAQSGGRTFYRLRAQGFADADDARRFCAALTAEKADCIPVAIR